jgi:hypothetical protein
MTPLTTNCQVVLTFVMSSSLTPLSETQSRRREGLSIFPQELTYQDQLVQRQLRDRLAKAIILLLKILQALGLIELETAIVAPPAIIVLLRDTKTLTDQTDRLPLAQPNLRLAQHPDDLFGRKCLPCHSLFSLKRVENGRIRLINLVSVQGSRPYPRPFPLLPPPLSRRSSINPRLHRISFPHAPHNFEFVEKIGAASCVTHDRLYSN